MSKLDPCICKQHTISSSEATRIISNDQITEFLNWATGRTLDICMSHGVLYDRADFEIHFTYKGKEVER